MIYRFYSNAAPDTLAKRDAMEKLEATFDLIQSAENGLADWESHLKKSGVDMLPDYYQNLKHKIEIRKKAIARLRIYFNNQLEKLRYD